MSHQKALILEKPKGPFVLNSNFPVPKLLPGHLLVKIQASALNPVDWKIQAFDFAVKSYPAVLGTDIAGDIVEVGEGVQGFSKGERVFFQGFFVNEYGGFQEYTTIPTDIVAKIPDGFSYAEVATIPLTFTTAAIGLFAENPIGAGLNPTLDSNLKYTDEPVLVIGGSTSVGQYAIQLLKYHGFKTIIAYASQRHEAFLKSLGATHLIDRGAVPVDKLPLTVKEITSAPLKIVYDAVGDAPSQNAGYAALADGGQLATVAASSVKDPVPGKTVISVWGTSHTPSNRKFGNLIWKKLPQYLTEKIISPLRIEEVPNGLAGIADGLEKLKNNQVSGVKLVAYPPDTP